MWAESARQALYALLRMAMTASGADTDIPPLKKLGLMETQGGPRSDVADGLRRTAERIFHPQSLRTGPHPLEQIWPDNADVHHYCETHDRWRTVKIAERIFHPQTLRTAPPRLKPIWSDKAYERIQ